MSPPDRWRPSVTVAAVICDGGSPARYLLVEEHTPEGLRLNNPAGHLDPGESPQQGVVREALEETARVFTPQALVGVYLARFQRPANATSAGEDITYLRLAYCGTVGDELPGLRLDTGIVRTLWLTAEEMRASAARHRSPLVLQCLEDHLAGRRYPLEIVSTDASVLAQPPQLPASTDNAGFRRTPTAMSRIAPFHLAFPVADLASTRAFYGGLLGCAEGRSSPEWIDYDFFGHQIVAHLAPAKADVHHNEVDGHDVPVPHFGVVLEWDQFHSFAARLREQGVTFVIEPGVRFAGQVGEQATMFFKDPSGNALEFKAFKDIGQLFAK